LDVARATGLSVEEVVTLHSAPLYTVFAVGSHAGYCYLGGLDPRLFVPRRAVPLLSVPAGSLSVAGMQTGVSASAGPSGWHTIGAADVRFFDPTRDPPSLLQPGDRVRFQAERVIL
jgi:KipI family sensor histidine kinase inhibitor